MLAAERALKFFWILIHLKSFSAAAVIGVHQMFGHKRRSAIKERAKRMGRMVMLLTDGLYTKSYDQFVERFPIRVAARMKLRAMPASRDLRCASHQPAGTKRRHLCTRTRNIGFASRALATIAVSHKRARAG